MKVMKLEISNKMLTFAIIGLVAVIVLALVINRYRSKSKFEWPVPTPQEDDTKLASDLQGYQDTFNLSMIGVNAMPAGDAKTAAIMAAETTLSNAINTRVGTYVSSKCPAVSSGSKPADTGDATVDAANTAAWNAYQSDLAKVQQAYYSVVGAATASSTPPSEQVLAARKADISGATRKYIATVCPNFYKTATSDPTNDYKTWAYVETGNAPANGLLKTDVTNANITTWAGYAAKTKSTTSSVTVLPGAGSGTVDLPALAVADTTGFAVGDSVQFTYQVVNKDTGATTTSAPVMGSIKTLNTAAPIGIVITVTSVPATGYVVPSGTVIAKAMVPASTTWSKLDAAGVPNWKKARDYGPGSYPKPTWGTV
jgi:hypothetical protein